MFLKLTSCVLALVVMAFNGDAYATTITFGSGLNQFAMEFVPIGNPGNAADTRGAPNPVGSVGYAYQMGKYEVSRDMITKANTLGGLGITLQDMTLYGGNGANRPATGISWNEAARFANWLNTSTEGFPAYKFITSGTNDNIALWTPADVLDYDAANPFRSLRAKYVLPSVDEWFKAAYYNPVTSSYFEFPTLDGVVPLPVVSGTANNTAVMEQSVLDGPADITMAGGLNVYGVMALAGNVSEWQETSVNNDPTRNRYRRGGDWASYRLGAGSSFISSNAPTSQIPVTNGLRIASLSVPAAVPEPSSMIIWCAINMSGLMYRRHRTINS